MSVYDLVERRAKELAGGATDDLGEYYASAIGELTDSQRLIYEKELDLAERIFLSKGVEFLRPDILEQAFIDAGFEEPEGE